MSTTVDQQLSIEARLRRLDEIAQALEAEDVELDEALALFGEGVAQLRAARQTLAQAELRIERLIADADGAPVVEPGAGAEP